MLFGSNIDALFCQRMHRRYATTFCGNTLSSFQVGRRVVVHRNYHHYPIFSLSNLNFRRARQRIVNLTQQQLHRKSVIVASFTTSLCRPTQQQQSLLLVREKNGSFSNPICRLYRTATPTTSTSTHINHNTPDIPATKMTSSNEVNIETKAIAMDPNDPMPQQEKRDNDNCVDVADEPTIIDPRKRKETDTTKKGSSIDQNDSDDDPDSNKNQTKRQRGPGRWLEHDTSPNNGSYAHPDMQKLFNVQIPSHLLQQNAASEEDEKTTTTSSKRKVAFLLGYLGTNYIGFQMNDKQKTLQAEFEWALVQCNLIRPSNFGFPGKYNWSTSGRTDKGVHACAQVVSAKIELPTVNTKSLDDIRSELNQILPSDFQVLDIVRTTRNFCAKTGRDTVRYQYMIPSFVFMDPSTVRSIFQTIIQNNQKEQRNGGVVLDDNHNAVLSSDVIQAAQKEFYKYRITKEQLETLQNSLKVYEGTHSFHNFSRRVNAEEARAARYILSFDVEEPIVFSNDTSNDVEWIPTHVIGQSFLLNQIRKMICLGIDVTRGIIPKERGSDFIQQALKRDVSVRLSQAPPHGLFLEMSYYDKYNRKIKKTNPDLPTINWSSTDTPVYHRWKEFRNNCIMKHISDEEMKEGNFISYLYNQEYIFNYKKYYGLNDGIVKR